MAEGDLHIDRGALVGYSDALDAILAGSLDGLDEEIWPYAELMVSDPENREMWRDAITDAVYSRAATGIYHSQAEADGFFDELSRIGRWGAKPTGHGDDEELYDRAAGTVRRALGCVFDRSIPEERRREEFMTSVGGFMGREVGLSANRAMIENIGYARKAGKDIRFVSVPMGSETCTFCAMQASKDYELTRLEDGHWHAGCKCRAVPGKKGTKIPGYDPDEWYDTWKTYEEIDSADGLGTVDKEILKEKAYAKSQLGVTFDDQQFGEKISRHAADFDILPSQLGDNAVRKSVLSQLISIIKNNDEVLDVSWRGQKGPCKAYIKDGYVVLVSVDGQFITAFKEIEGGNRRINDARANRGRSDN